MAKRASSAIMIRTYVWRIHLFVAHNRQSNKCESEMEKQKPDEHKTTTKYSKERSGYLGFR